MNRIGNYKLIKKLGEGGMGSVFLGEDTLSKNKVAIKIVKNRFTDTPIILARFRKEISLCKEFAHPFVVKILDGGNLTNRDILYLVMEYLPGLDLSEACHSRRISPSQAQKIMLHMAEALSYIHKKGIIHRDIKGENIFIVSEERTVLLDFGLALCEDSTRLSQTEDRPGTFSTMSPEQLMGTQLDCRSDIYSLAVTMYYAMTKILPYTTDEIIKIASGRPVSPPKPLSMIRTDVDKNLSQIVMNCLFIEPEKRPQSAEALKALLLEKKKYVPLPHQERRLKTSSERHKQCASGKELTVSDIHRPTRHYRRTMLVKVVAALCIAISGMVLFFAGKQNLCQTHTLEFLESSVIKIPLPQIKNADERRMAFERLANELLRQSSEVSVEQAWDLGEGIKSIFKDSDYEYGIAHRSDVLGLYGLIVHALKNENWSKAYVTLITLIQRHGFYPFSNNEISVRKLTDTVGWNGKSYKLLLDFHEKFSSSALEADQKRDRLLALSWVLLDIVKSRRLMQIERNKTWNLSSKQKKKAVAHQNRAFIARVLKIGTEIKDQINATRSGEYISVQWQALMNDRSERNRTMALSFLQEWMQREKCLSRESLVLLYFNAGKTLYNKATIPNRENRSNGRFQKALFYFNRAISLYDTHLKGTDTSTPDIHTSLLLQKAEVLKALDKLNEARDTCISIKTEYPIFSESYPFVLTYSSVLAATLDYESAYTLVAEYVKEHEQNASFDNGQRAEFRRRLHKFEQMKGLMNLKTPFENERETRH